MRLAVFITLALLTSASPIDNNDSRKSTSLWKRHTPLPNPIEYHDIHTGVTIRDEFDEDRKIKKTIVTLIRQRTNRMTFFPQGAASSGDQQKIFIPLLISDSGGLEVHARDFTLSSDRGTVLLLTSMKLPDERWITFQPNHRDSPGPTQNSGTIFMTHALNNRVKVRLFYENEHLVLVYVKYFKNGEWREGTMPHDLENDVNWLPPPNRVAA